MNVKKLIKILKTMPQNADIYMADHDHGTFETNTIVGKCELINKKDMTINDNDDNCGESDCFKYTPQIYVVVRP